MLSLNPRINEFAVSQAIIWIPMLLGVAARRQGLIAERRGTSLHRVSFCFFAPAIQLLGIWRFQAPSSHWLWPPLLNAAMLCTSLVIGWQIIKRLRVRRQTAGTLSLMFSLSNQGYTMAGFLTILLISDQAYGYNALLMLAGPILLGFVWLPICHYCSRGKARGFGDSLRGALLSQNAMPLAAMIVGLTLNYLHVPLPNLIGNSLRWIVLLGAINAMFAIGLQMHVRRFGGYQRLLMPVYLMKFLILPLLMLTFCLLAGLHGEMLGALLIASCVPTGVMTVSLSSIYQLDVDLANAGYIFTTGVFMLLVLPLLILGLPWILRTIG